MRAAICPRAPAVRTCLQYFRNDAKSTNGENIFYAVSKDGYNYESLNGGVPVASASQGTGHSRDPYIMKAQDGAAYKYYMVATDANTTNNYNNTGLHTWGSNDLISWDELAKSPVRHGQGRRFQDHYQHVLGTGGHLGPGSRQVYGLLRHE